MIIIILKKRAKTLFTTAMILLFVLCLRVFYISVFKNSDYKNAVFSQSVASMSLGKMRGIIYDRNLISLTDRETEEIYIGGNGKVTKTNSKIKIIKPKRYGNEPISSHTLGYCGNEGGLWGIEKIYDRVLKRDKNYELTYSANSLGGPGIGKAFSKEFKRDDGNGVMLTIDYHIQKIAQDVLKKHVKSGAVVILDVESFDVLAMASLPDFDKSLIDQHLTSDGTELLNRGLCQYNPGSVFKIVTSLSLLENGFMNTDSQYVCTGSYITPDFHTFPCHKSDGHGTETMKSAFANSCNCFFYNAGVNLGASKICETAKKLGLGASVLGFGDEESTGNIPEKNFYTPGDRANISIGQGEIMMTPIQCASLAATVASGGIKKDINIADAVVNVKGEKIEDLKRYGVYETIKEESAKALGEMMRECVISGTAKSALKSSIEIAGKTGSAETGWIQDGESISVHGWFCGYFPYESPKYAMAILSENGKSGSMSCVEPFVEICEEINKIYPIKQ